MNDQPSLGLPWRCGQKIKWYAAGVLRVGTLTTWRGPRPDGHFVLTAMEMVGERLVLVTLVAPDPQAPAAAITEAARYA